MVKRKFSFSKKFWTWKRIASLAVILVFIGANAVWLYQPFIPESLGFPTALGPPNGSAPSVNLPINRTAVSQFVNDTIADYLTLLANKQEKWANFTSIETYFTLYRPSGSWNVQVARDIGNWADWIEFIFRLSESSSPHTIVFTNESAAYLRPLTGTTLSVNNVSIRAHPTKYGLIMSNYYSESAVGPVLIPLVYLTNSSFVYGDVAVNANNAARTIYQYDIDVMNHLLNPPYPSVGWLERVWTVYGGYVEFFGLALSIITGIIYLQREGYLQFKRSSRTEQEPRPEDRAP